MNRNPCDKGKSGWSVTLCVKTACALPPWDLRHSGGGDSKQIIPQRSKSLQAVASAKRRQSQDYPGGSVVKNPPANALDMGSIPGPGRSHMLQGN